MKISASIYSNDSQDLASTVKVLEDHHIDMLHIDCVDRPNVFQDVRQIRKISTLPIDLHLITKDPSKYESMLTNDPVDLLTIQLETMNGSNILPSSGFKKLGLALTSDTPIDSFGRFSDRCDFVLLMATEPGKSGGTFNKDNFRRIREFKRKFPNKQVHVDGGVNAEVSFILRNLGVHCAVSGSFLFKQSSVGGAVLSLKHLSTDSHYRVADFMRDLSETPSISVSDVSLRSILTSIEDSKMAFTTVVATDGTLHGIVSNADVRKGFLKNIENLNGIQADTLINRDPITVQEKLTVTELLRFIRHQPIPINFLPVINGSGKLVGSLTFNDLIKGEA